jgi:hypothetical protein
MRKNGGIPQESILHDKKPLSTTQFTLSNIAQRNVHLLFRISLSIPLRLKPH